LAVNFSTEKASHLFPPQEAKTKLDFENISSWKLDRKNPAIDHFWQATGFSVFFYHRYYNRPPE